MASFTQIAKDSQAEGWEPYNGDNIELCYHIHALQNWVLSNAASHDEPEMYRPFGCKHKEKINTDG